MPRVTIVTKPPANDDVLKVTSETLEEKIFLSGIYDRRIHPSELIDNPDGSVTLVITY